MFCLALLMAVQHRQGVWCCARCVVLCSGATLSCAIAAHERSPRVGQSSPAHSAWQRCTESANSPGRSASERKGYSSSLQQVINGWLSLFLI